jgi:hypothetical protein
MTKTELAYPNAVAKRNAYKRVVDAIDADQNVIWQAVHTYLIPLSGFLQKGLLGEYYDEYVRKSGDWLDDASSIISEFRMFDDELRVRKLNAVTQQKLWENRIGLKD